MAVVLPIRDGVGACAGFVWDSSEAGIGRMEARTRARRQKANAHVLRAGDKNLGVGSLPVGTEASRRLVSLAGALASAVDEQTWCGVVDVDGTLVFIGVSSGVVLADGDTVYESRASAEERLRAEIELFDKAFAPEAWDIRETKSSDALLREVDWATAEQVQFSLATGSSPRLVLLAVVLLGASSLAAWGYFKDHASEEAAQIVPQLAPPPAQSWTKMPTPLAAMTECLRLREMLSGASRDGWLLTSLTCEVQSQKFAAVLTPFTDGNRLPSAGEGVTIAMKSDGNGLDVSGPMAAATSAERHTEKPSLADVLQARNFIVGLSAEMAWQSDKGRHQFNFRMPANFDGVAARLASVPTLSLTRLEMKGDDWRVYGEVWQ